MQDGTGFAARRNRAEDGGERDGTGGGDVDAGRHGEGGARDGEGEGSKSNFDARDEARGGEGGEGHGGGGTAGHRGRGEGAGAAPCGKPQGTVA